jgi:glycosyltransferase involved in cell wall biosynthesis
LKSISIVIPAYNEENRLPATLDRVLEYLNTRHFPSSEVIVVDDGSTDGTAAAAVRYGEGDSRVRLLRNPGNHGKGYSVRHGMLEAEGEWRLFTDADLSAPIEELDKLLAAVRDNQASVAIGSRALNRSLIQVHQSFFRETAGRIFNLLMQLLTGLPFWDTQCGFKLFDARAAHEVFRRQRIEGFGFDVEVLFIARRLRFHTVEVAVRWSHAEGTKVRMLKDSVGMFADLARVRWNDFRGLYR